MGSNNGKQCGKTENNKRRTSFRRIFQTNNTSRPVSYAGTNQYHEEHQASIRPLSMIDAVPLNNLETSENNY
jgi:hypothetical protein